MKLQYKLIKMLSTLPKHIYYIFAVKGLESKFEFDIWIEGLNLRLGFKFWIRGLNLRFGFGIWTRSLRCGKVRLS